MNNRKYTNASRTKKFYENKNLATHRANKPACELIWKIEYDTQRTCQNHDCGEKFPTVENAKKTHSISLPPKKNANTSLNKINIGKKRQENNTRKGNTTGKRTNIPRKNNIQHRNKQMDMQHMREKIRSAKPTKRNTTCM